MTETSGPAPLTTTRRTHGDVLIVEVTGEIDMDTAPQLQTELSDALRHAAGGVCVVDLTAVSYLGSAGLNALLSATQEAEQRHEPLRLVVDANRPVVRPIMVTGLSDVLSLYHSMDEALRAGRQP